MPDAPQAKSEGHRKTTLLKPVSPVLEPVYNLWNRLS